MSILCLCKAYIKLAANNVTLLPDIYCTVYGNGLNVCKFVDSITTWVWMTWKDDITQIICTQYIFVINGNIQVHFMRRWEIATGHRWLCVNQCKPVFKRTKIGTFQSNQNISIYQHLHSNEALDSIVKQQRRNISTHTLHVIWVHFDKQTKRWMHNLRIDYRWNFPNTTLRHGHTTMALSFSFKFIWFLAHHPVAFNGIMS